MSPVAARRRRLLKLLLWAGGIVAGLLVVLGAIAALRMAGVARDLRAARDSVRLASSLLEDGRVAEARAELDDAQGRLAGANSSLRTGPELSVLGLLPVFSQNLDALRDTVEVGLSLIAGGNSLLAVADPLQGPDGRLDVSLRQGSVPVDAVGEARSRLRALATSLPAAGSRPSSPLLLPPVNGLVDEVFDEIDEQRPRVSNLGDGLTVLHELVGGNGDRRYLLAVANTAEMRGTGGMILSYGVIEAGDGSITLGAFGPIDELFLVSPLDPAAVGASDDELDRWSGLEPLRLWRNANLIPDPAVVGVRLEALAETATGLSFDGVVFVDPAGLAAVLAGVGPVEVEDVGAVDAANVVDLTLNQVYAEFSDQDQRREVIGEVAEAAFQRLVDGEYPSLRPLATALAEAAAGRHLILRSADPAVVDAVSTFQGDGALPDPMSEYLHLTVQNFGRDKLDYYLDTAVVVRGERPAGETGELTVEITVTNTAPPGQTEPAYVFGEDDGRTSPPGTYVGIGSLYVPAGSALEAADTGDGTGGGDAVLSTEAGRTLVAFDVHVPAGSSRTVVLRLSLPPRPGTPYSLRLTPVPRVRPTSWDVAIEAGGSATRSGPLLVPEQVSVR